MATSLILSASTPISTPILSPLNRVHARNLIDWDAIVQVTSYQPKCTISADETIPSDAPSQDLSNLDKVIQQEMCRVNPCEIENETSSSDSELITNEDDKFFESHDDQSTLDYATVDQNGFDELMRFGLYELGDEPVCGVSIIDPRSRSTHTDIIPSNINNMSYASNTPAKSAEQEHTVHESDNSDLSAIDYATVDENGLDELMRFGLYEPGGDPVHGVLIEPCKPRIGHNHKNTSKERPSADLADTFDGVDASRSHMMHMFSLMTWCDGNSCSDDESGCQMGTNHADIQQSQSFSSHSSTVMMYDESRISHRFGDAGDIETLPDDDSCTEDIETPVSARDLHDENDSEMYFGEIETLDDSDDNSVRILDETMIDCSSDLAATVAAKLDALFSISHETVSDNAQKVIRDKENGGSVPCEKFLSSGAGINGLSHRIESVTTNNNTVISSSFEKSSASKSKSTRADTIPTRDTGKKVSKFKKVTRMIKTCFSKSKKWKRQDNEC